MFQTETLQFEFPTQPSLAEFVCQLLLAWLIALTLITAGIYVFHRKRNIWARLAALLASALGGVFCFLLGFSFTPINHHRYGWSSTDQDLNDWINGATVLIVWGISSFLFWAVRKIVKRGKEQIEPNAN